MRPSVQGRPDAPAVIQGERSLTFGQLDAWANRVAHALVERGVGPESSVGLLVTRSLAANSNFPRFLDYRIWP